MNSKKIANNILEFLFDPTVIPVERRMYFGPEERLDNGNFEKAKADSLQAYGKENKNSDFYPSKNRQQTQREAGYIMDRKTIIASLDVLSQNFDESDPIGEGLRAMAYTVSKMADEEFETRTAKKKIEFVTCPKCGNKKVMKQTGYCIKCGKKGIGKDEKKEDKDDKKKKANEDFWTKAASEAVALALVEDVVGTSDDAKEEDDEKEAKKAPVVPEEDEKEAKKAPVVPDEEDEKEAKKVPVVPEEDEKEAKKAPVVPEEDEKEAKKAPVVPEEDEKEAKKAPVVPEEDEKEAKKAPVVPEEDEKEARKKKEDDVCPPPEKEAKKEDTKKSKVNTDILSNIEGIEMDLGALSLDEVELTASDKEQLGQLFQ